MKSWSAVINKENVVCEHPQIKKRGGLQKHQKEEEPLLAVVIYSLNSSELE